MGIYQKTVNGKEEVQIETLLSLIPLSVPTCPLVFIYGQLPKTVKCYCHTSLALQALIDLPTPLKSGFLEAKGHLVLKFCSYCSCHTLQCKIVNCCSHPHAHAVYSVRTVLHHFTRAQMLSISEDSTWVMPSLENLPDLPVWVRPRPWLPLCPVYGPALTPVFCHTILLAIL